MAAFSFRPGDADRRRAKGVAVPTVPLPGELSFEQLRKQAKDLQRAVRAEDPAALAELAERYPDRPIPGQAPAAPRGLRRPAALSLSAAQLVVARRYGFASWTRLKRHAETVERLSRYPARMDAEAGGTLSPDTVSPGSAGSGTVSVGTIGAGRDLASLTDAFLRLACLTYEDDQPERWQQARRLLAAHPEISQHSVYPAAACADTGALRAILGADPAAARREGGPYRWEPLLYLAYARHDPAVPQDAVLGAARLLLAAGADPNAGYLWHGFTSPFTALTGVLGEGELGPVRQPPHPHWQALARLLLAAGAEPNDPQGLYNRMFEPGAEHLALLFEFGLGAGDGGPWRRLLGERDRSAGQPGAGPAGLGDHPRHGRPGAADRRARRRPDGTAGRCQRSRAGGHDRARRAGGLPGRARRARPGAGPGRRVRRRRARGRHQPGR
jgi:hypothetical protein